MAHDSLDRAAMKKQKLKVTRTTLHLMSASDTALVNGGSFKPTQCTCPPTGIWCPVGTIGPAYTTAC